MPKKLTRRSFLSYLLVSAATASFVPKYAFGNIFSNNSPESNWLSFSSQKGIGPWLDESTLKQRYCALHKETALPDIRIDQSDYRKTISLLEKVLADQGVRWKKSSRIVWKYQHYGVCDPSIHSEKLLSYSRLTQDYLYSHISGLLEINLDWDLLIKNHTRSFIETKGYRGLVGKHTYLVYRVNGVDDEGTLLQPGLANIMPVERAINYIIDDDHHKPIGSTIFVIHGPTSLISPFTELIHLIIHQPTLLLTRELAASQGEVDAQIVGRVYGESIAEGAGILLALSFLQKYGRTNEENIVIAVAQNIVDQYPLVQGVITYMDQNGIQRVLSDYSENPVRVMKDIEKIAIN
jgi:hypothetical protein